MNTLIWLGILAAGTGQVSHLTPVAKGASDFLGGYYPASVKLTDHPIDPNHPDPANLDSPHYASVLVQGTPLYFLIDKHQDRIPTLYYRRAKQDWVRMEWKASSFKRDDQTKKTTCYAGTLTTQLTLVKRVLWATYNVYAFSDDSPQQDKVGNQVFFYPDYGVKGTLTTKDATYSFFIIDHSGSGDFTSKYVKGTKDLAVEATFEFSKTGKYQYGFGGGLGQELQIGLHRYKLSSVGRYGSSVKFKKLAR